MWREMLLFFVRDLRIRYKLLFGYSGILLALSFLGGVATYAFVRNMVAANIQTELKTTTSTILSMVRTTAQTSIRNRLRAIAETNREIVAYFHNASERGFMDEKEAKKAAQTVLLGQTIGTTGYIYCLDSQGVIVMHPRPRLLGRNISEYEFIQDQMRRREGYLEYSWQNPGEEKPRPKALYMIYFKPWDWIISVSSYREEFTALINVDDFKSSILNLRFGTTGYSYVLDSRGNIVIHPYLTGNLFNAKDSEGAYFVKEICRRKTGQIVYTWQNPGETHFRKKLAVFNYIPEFDWIVISSSYHEEFFSPLDTVKKIFIVIALITLLLIIPLSFSISRSITHPLHQLRKRLEIGAKGDLSVRMEIQADDEIGELAGYFNQFMARLEDEQEKRQQAERDRRRMLEQLQQSQKMEAIGQLAGGVAHDFNNILTAIIGSAEMLKLKVDPPKQRLIENIIQASSRASELTRNLLDFARKGTLQQLPVDIHAMLDEVITLLSHSIDKRIVIDTQLESENPIILGDPSKLQNALLNLGINARDAMPDGGTIRFVTADVTIERDTTSRFGELLKGSYLKISVEDKGVGIPEADLERVFEPFYTTKEQGKGTGLGLASVYGSIMVHNGQIDIQSTPGSGTNFCIYLPAVDFAMESETSDSATGVVFGSGNIMIVDDEDFVRNYATSALKKLGYSVANFGDPRGAIDHFHKHHEEIDLVLLDLMMPTMNGRETLEALLRVDPDIPVIIASGYGKKQEGDLLKDGACHFLRKPFRLQALSHLVDRFKRKT
jgi:signal transduction histidine kinase/CheY-like chemotaxis protein